MFQRSLLAVFLVALVLLACTVMPAKDNPMGIAEQQRITFTAPMMVGGTLLPPGDYTVTHQMNGQTHVMVFKKLGGNAEAKANCKLVPLPAKAERTEQRYTINAQNERVLQEMTFAGDKATHLLVQ